MKDVSIVTMEHDESVAMVEETAHLQRLLALMVDPTTGLHFETIITENDELPYCFTGSSFFTYILFSPSFLLHNISEFDSSQLSIH